MDGLSDVEREEKLGELTDVEPLVIFGRGRFRPRVAVVIKGQDAVPSIQYVLPHPIPHQQIFVEAMNQDHLE